MRLVQLMDARGIRRVALVDEPQLRLLASYHSVYALAHAAESSLRAVVENDLSDDTLDYDSVYTGASPWHLLPPLDHPNEPARCMVSGTGLTHLASAANRQAMHAAAVDAPTDSMRMYQWGVEGGKPPAGQAGIAPEWFYKGSGAVLRGHGDPLLVPSYAEDGGEEPEIAGLYVNDVGGAPVRVGFAQGNEFSDHRFEKRNYLNLAGSKLRNCSIGPELLVNAAFKSISGTVSIERSGQMIWSAPIKTGEEAMSHSLANIEHHHFKFESHRRPGDVHIHYFGASAFSFGAGVTLDDGDIMQVAFEGCGRPLRNPLRTERTGQPIVTVRKL